MVAPPPAAPATDDIFLARAEALLKDGDFAAARLFFQRSVARGNPLAALGMGKTYDPVFFAKSGIIGARGDRKVASEWYRKAAAAGILEADDRLRQLELDYGDSTFRPSR
jgi:TPR repeat protein